MDITQIIVITDPIQMTQLATICCKNMRSQGFRISDRDFFDPSKLRTDPVAALWYHNIFVSREQAQPFMQGFRNKNLDHFGITNFEIKNQYYVAGKIIRGRFID